MGVDSPLFFSGNYRVVAKSRSTENPRDVIRSYIIATMGIHNKYDRLIK